MYTVGNDIGGLLSASKFAKIFKRQGLFIRVVKFTYVCIRIWAVDVNDSILF